MRKLYVAISSPDRDWGNLVGDCLQPLMGERVQWSAASLDRIRETSGSVDIAVFTDPGAGTEIRELLRPLDVDVVVARYSLTRRAWTRLAALPRATELGMADSESAAAALGDALLRLGRQDLIIRRSAAESANPQRLELTVPESLEPGGRLRIDAPRPAASTVLELLWLLGHYDEEALAQVRRYLRDVEPLREDAEFFLDKTIELKARLNRATRLTGHSIIHFDQYNDVVDVGGPLENLLELQGRQLLGLPLQELCPDLEALNEMPVVERAQRAVRIGNRSFIAHISSFDDGSGTRGGVIRLSPVLSPSQEAEASGDRRAEGLDRPRYALQDIVTEDPGMLRIKALAERAASRDSPVMLMGESGTGKELFAQAIHNLSLRREGPFIAINCGAIAETLLESELFGYEHGAFTGARKGGRASLFERARGGTVFLDELGELSPRAQAALLRVLEERELQRLGGDKVIALDVRIIAAMSGPAEDLIAGGRFRRDLYHRLCVIPIQIPPLRERGGDLELLARRFLEDLGYEAGPLLGRLRPWLHAYPWPGNVRELRHCIEYMAAVGEGQFAAADLPPHVARYLGFKDARSPYPTVPVGAYAGATGAPALDGADLFLLESIGEAHHRQRPAGRRSLADQARSRGLVLSEGEVRSRLQLLKGAGLVAWRRGRGGVKLTPSGREALERAGHRAGAPNVQG